MMAGKPLVRKATKGNGSYVDHLKVYVILQKKIGLVLELNCFGRSSHEFSDETLTSLWSGADWKALPAVCTWPCF